MNISNQSLCNCSEEKIKAIVADAINSSDAGDATWILTSAFIIFTMQSGFGLLEAGTCSAKNESNIMMKNAIDVVFGALGYWICGFGLSFGHDDYANGFTGVGSFLTDSTDSNMGHLFAKYFFQLSFATTATTIVSGAMAERTNLKAYMLFSFLNMFSYVFPAHWIWDEHGFLFELGAVDVAGCGPVHLIGGTSALVATMMLKPRHKRFDKDEKFNFEPSSPVNVVLGLFMLWWGWLGFNCGSTFGVSGGKWKLASRAAVVTVNGSVGGGIFAIIYCYVLTKKYKGKLDVGIFSTGVLGGLVSITAICAICRPWEALIIGFIGSFVACYGTVLMEWCKIDDPVSCIPVHGFASIWGLLCVGLFAEKDDLDSLNDNPGLFKGGGAALMGYQALASVCFCAWAAVTTAIELFVADKAFGLRMSLEDELVGADFAEHGIEVFDSSISKPSHPHFEETEDSPVNTKVVNLSTRKRFPTISEILQHENVTTRHNEVKTSKYWDTGLINFSYVTISDSKVISTNNERATTEDNKDIVSAGSNDGAEIW